MEQVPPRDVRRKAQQEREDLYRSLIELSPDAVMVHSEGVVVFLNAAGVRLFGADSPADVLGKAVLAFVHPDHHDAVRKRMRLSYEHRASAPRIETRALRVDGTAVDVEVSTAPIAYEGKRATLTMLRDITERKRTEKEMRRFASFPAANPNPVLEFDARGTISFYNIAAMNVLREMNCEKDFGLFLPSDADDLFMLLRAPETAARIFQREVPIRDRVYLEALYIAPQFGTLRIYAYDITERKRNEDLLRVKDKAIATAMSGIVFSDMSGRLTYVNDAFLALWGYGAVSEVLGRHVREFWSAPAEAEQVVAELGRRDHWRGELPAKRRDGSVFPAEVSASFVRDERGTPICMMAAFSDISDRKRAADALRRSHDDLERRVRERTAALRDAHHEIASLLEEIGDGFFALDRDWRFRYLNSRAEQFFKRDAPALIGKGLWDVQPELAGTIYQEEFERSFRDRIPVSFEAQFPGRPIWVEVRAFAAPDGLSVFLHEISERKEMERHLQVTADLLKLYTLARSREEYLEAAVNILKGWCGCNYLGVRLSDGKGGIPFASCSGYTARFLSTEHLLSLHDDDCVCTRIVLGAPEPRDRAAMTPAGAFVCNDLKLFQEDLAASDRGRYRGACMAHGFRSLAVVPVRHREQTLGAIHVADERPGVVPPRTAETLEHAALIIGEALFRFGIEVDLVRNYAALKDSEERYRSLVQDVPDVIFTLTRQGHIASLNPAFERLFGMPADEWIGRHFSGLLHPEDLPKADRQFQRALSGQTLPLVSLRAVAADGKPRFLEIMISGEQRSDGRILGIARDVTEKLRLESIAESVSMMDNIGSVFAGVRHEIGNPVNSISMILRMLASKLDELPKEKLRDYVKRMKEQAGRVEYLLHSLKSFNLFDTQEPRRVRVETFMKNFLPLLAVAYEKQGIRLETDIAPEADWMYVDARALQHVLLNVLTNASEALTGRGDPCVAITIIRERDRIRFDVEDNGPGIPPERLKQVFLPFYTTKKDGTGLGLVIVQKMLTRMNGTIGLESRDGGGTTAVITVPADDGGRTGGRGDATAVPRGREESEA